MRAEYDGEECHSSDKQRDHEARIVRQDSVESHGFVR